ncbi:PfkB family carbohydrate kinase [Stetteria hydrogenophila]
MTRLLVVAAPTIDLPGGGGKPRPGGPTIYAGCAGALLGCEALASGPVGLEHAGPVVEAHRRLGVRLEPIYYPGPSFVFRLTYEERGRRAELAAAPRGGSIPLTLLASLLSRARPDVVVFSPVAFEVPPPAVPLALLSGARVVAVDPQGYSRVLGGAWPSALARGGYTFIHYSADDAQPAGSVPGLVYYTRGAEEGAVMLNGAKLGVIPRPRRVLSDPTGAGDAFTAAVACCLAGGGDVVECAREAVSIVPEALEEAHRAAEEASRALGLLPPPPVEPVGAAEGVKHLPGHEVY